MVIWGRHASLGSYKSENPCFLFFLQHLITGFSSLYTPISPSLSSRIDLLFHQASLLDHLQDLRLIMASEVKHHFDYSLLGDDSEKGEVNNFLSQEPSPSDDAPLAWYKPQHLSMRSLIAICPWVSNFVLVVICIVLFSKLPHHSGEFGLYEAGFRSDMSKYYGPNHRIRQSN